MGKGAEGITLKQKIKQLALDDSIKLCGYVSKPLNYMYNAELFVLPSLIEGAPNVLVEAMARDCQVISTDSSGSFSELLHNGEYGALVPISNHQVLASTILDVYSGKRSFKSGKTFALQLTKEVSLKNYISSCGL